MLCHGVILLPVETGMLIGVETYDKRFLSAAKLEGMKGENDERG